MGHSGSIFFFYFVFSTLNSKYVDYKILLMTRFEPRTTGIGSDTSANCATTTVLFLIVPFSSVTNKSHSEYSK